MLRKRRARIERSWSYVARARLFSVPVDLPKYKVVSVHTGSAREHVDSTHCRPGLRFLFVFFVIFFLYRCRVCLVSVFFCCPVLFFSFTTRCLFGLFFFLFFFGGAPVSVFLRPTGLTCFVLGDSLGLGARQRLGGGAAGQRARQRAAAPRRA